MVDNVEDAPAYTKDNFPSWEEFEFRITKVMGKDLAAKDIGGSSDPYILLGFIGENDVLLDKKKGGNVEGGVFYKSPTESKSLEFCFQEAMKEKQELKRFKIEIWDKDTISADDWMGSYIVEPQELVDSWLKQGKTWTNLNNTSALISNVRVSEGLKKKEKVKGTLSFVIALSHPNVHKYAEMEKQYKIHQNQVRVREQNVVEKEKELAKQKKKEEEQKKKDKKKKEQEKKNKDHLECIPGYFEGVKTKDDLYVFLERNCAARGWLEGEKEFWDSRSSKLTTKEVVEKVGQEEFYRVLTFYEEIETDLLFETIGFITGLKSLVDFSKMEGFGKVFEKIRQQLKDADKDTEKLVTSPLRDYYVNYAKGRMPDAVVQPLQDCVKYLLVSEKEREEVGAGDIQPKQKWDEDREPIRRIGDVILNHLHNWEVEHEQLTLKLLRYIESIWIKNMNDTYFWKDVAELIFRFVKKDHRGLDKAMQNKTAFTVVDGIGANLGVISSSYSPKDLTPLKKIYKCDERWDFIGRRNFKGSGWPRVPEP